MAFPQSKIDYSDRTVDLLLLQFVKSPTVDAIVKPDVSLTPRMATGIEKLVQRYAQLFLTNIGSVVNRESYGTEFLEKLGRGRIYDDGTLRAQANAANLSVVTQIKSSDSVLETKADEALKGAEVVGVSTDRTTATVTVSVKITSEAGESYTYVTPIATGF